MGEKTKATGLRGFESHHTHAGGLAASTNWSATGTMGA
jgi:hypothetical protein